MTKDGRWKVMAPFYRVRSGKPQRLRYTALNGTSSSARRRQPPEPESSIRVPGHVPVTRIHRDSSRCLALLQSRSATHPSQGPTRLDLMALATTPPLEDKDPFSGSSCLVAQDSRDGRLPWREVQRRGQDVRQWLEGSDADQLRTAVLDHPMSEALPNVSALRALSPTNDVVSPLDARSVVLVHRSRGGLGEAHAVEEVTKGQDLRRRRRRRVVLRFG
jgi:hypothetical protein